MFLGFFGFKNWSWKSLFYADADQRTLRARQLQIHFSILRIPIFFQMSKLKTLETDFNCSINNSLSYLGFQSRSRIQSVWNHLLSRSESQKCFYWCSLFLLTWFLSSKFYELKMQMNIWKFDELLIGRESSRFYKSRCFSGMHSFAISSVERFSSQQLLKCVVSLSG